MRGAKRQLSQGSDNEEGLPIQHRRSSIPQAGTSRDSDEENYDGNRYTRYQVTHNNQYYGGSFHNAPHSYNGPIYGGVHNNPQIFTFDGLQFLYQHSAMGAIHESDERYPPPLCHPGTRDVVVGRAMGWYLDKSGQKNGIMWVHAPAGFGKTAIAGTVTEKLKAMVKELGFDPIGATFFFWRASPERSSPARFIITLAYQLAQSIPEFGPRVQAVVKSKPDIVKMGLELQVVKLIVEPFKSLPNLDSMPNRLVVVDGIDECINSDRESRLEKKYAEDQETTQIRVLELIRSFQSHHLPLSFLILSRPEAWIKQHLGSSAFRDVVEPLDLYRVGDHMNDVAKFVRAELSRIATSSGLENPDEEWPDEEWLVLRSEGQMVYASTAIRHIDDPYGDPRQLLKDIVGNTSSPDISHSTAFSSLYELYGQIMRSCPKRNRTLMIEVLGDIMSVPTFKGLPYGDGALGVLDRLSGRLPGSGLKALRPLHAVLRLGDSTAHVRNLFIHSSFGEFLQSPHASPHFFVDDSKMQEWTLSKMLDYMTSISIQDVVVGKGVDEVAKFIALNFWDLWGEAPSGTRATHMKKIIAVDLSAWIILRLTSSGPRPQDFDAFFWDKTQTPSKYLVSYMDLDRCDDTLSTAVHEVTSHWQSSFESAAIFMLHPNASGIPHWSLASMASDCVKYLCEVITQPGWRENKLVQALGSPGPGNSGLFEKVVHQLCQKFQRDPDRVQEHFLAGYPRGSERDGPQWAEEVGQLWGPLDKSQQCAWDMLEHLYEVMMRDQSPILEAEYLGFDAFLFIRDRRRTREAAQDILPPVMDVM